MCLPAGAAERDLQLPVWNATYQVRDFAQFVRDVTAHDAQGRTLPIRSLDKTTWRISGAAAGACAEYDTALDLPGPFGAQYNEHHAFLNWAMVLMYPVGQRGLPVNVALENLPAEWSVCSGFIECMGVCRTGVDAPNYDTLVDSPAEIGNFKFATFDQGGARYNVAIDADPADYNLESIVATLRRIVATETAWMNDRPFDHYTFIYHFPRGPAGGGMEHAYSTAIDASSERLKRNPNAIAGVTAHEFFHLWNVKRIRPQSLEPIDYTKEQYTTALWFSEGVTSTVGDYMLLRAGLTDERAFLARLADAIQELQSRPAHKTMSAEESSLNTWFDKYPAYRLPERSINYYNKGEILGVLLDLAMLEASNGRASLRELFQYMNREYAQKGRYFPDSDGVRQAAEAVSGGRFADFFARYVAGTDEIPYDDFFRSVGLRLELRTVSSPDAGFTTTRNFSDPPVISAITPGGAAAQAGLALGDIIVSVNDQQPQGDRLFTGNRPGDTVKMKITRRGATREVHLKLGERQTSDYRFVEVSGITPQQRARRDVWLGRASATASATPATGAPAP